MQARVFHIHEALVTLCPLIYKAQRSAESVPPGPPIKFNGLSAMTSKSLAVRLFANSVLCCLSEHTHPHPVPASNALLTHSMSSMWSTEAYVVYMQSLLLTGKKRNTIFKWVQNTIYYWRSSRASKQLQTSLCFLLTQRATPSGGVVSPPRRTHYLHWLPSLAWTCIKVAFVCQWAGLITRSRPAASLKHVNIKRG